MNKAKRQISSSTIDNISSQKMNLIYKNNPLLSRDERAGEICLKTFRNHTVHSKCFVLRLPFSSECLFLSNL